MSEPIEVEANPIDTEISVISGADKWLSETMARVAERCKLYKPPERIADEKGRKDAASSRAQVRKDRAEIDGERKAMLRGIEDALKSFKSSVKDILTPLDNLDAEYKRLLDEYEDAWRTERQIELAQEYEDLAPDLVPLVPFTLLLQRYGTESGKAWLNRSTNLVKAKQMMADAIFDVHEGEKAIDSLTDDADRTEAKALYFQTLDLNAALAKARQLKEQRARVQHLEAERAAREAQWEEPQPVVEPEPPLMSQPAPPQPVMQQPTTDVPHAWVIIASSATKAQMLQLRDYAKSVGIPFDCIYPARCKRRMGG